MTKKTDELAKETKIVKAEPKKKQSAGQEEPRVTVKAAVRRVFLIVRNRL